MRRTMPLAALLLLVAAGSAHAAFPGKNGKIVFRSNRAGNADVYTMDPDGSNRARLTRDPAEDVDPRWSPDGTRIVFASNRTGRFQLYTMAADGSDMRQVTSLAGDARRPTWTADGRILFQDDAAAPGNGRDLYSVAADGSGLIDLTPTSSDELGAATAPHGNKLAFSSNRDDGYHLYVQSGGSPPRAITSGDGFDFQPSWSPSGNDLVFIHVDASFSDGDVYVVHANGTGLRRLTSTPGRFETEPAWSPDGSTIAFHGCSQQDGCVIDEIGADGSGDTVVTRTFAAPFVDDFSSTPLDDFWSTQLVGSGVSVAQTGGRLQFDLSPSAAPDPGTGYANPIVFSACNLRGDFDMQVDYDLQTQPFPDWVNPTFNTGAFVNGQYTESNGIFLSKWGISGLFTGTPFTGFVPNVPPQGSMRLTRQGSTLTAYYSTGGPWQTLQTRNDFAADEVDAALSLFSNNLPGTDVRVAYDNFRVNSGTFACPTWWSDEAPDWQAR